MADAPDGLREKVKKGIAKSGFPLEMEIGNVLRSKNWFTIHSPRYFDIENLQYKEYDIRASRSGDNFDTQLFIECKRSADKQWVFYVPERYEGIYVQDLKFFPIKNDIQIRLDLTLLKETIFAVLTDYCDPSEVALNDSIFNGEKNIEDKNIREAVKTSIKALIGDNVGRHVVYSKVPAPPLRPRINFSVVVFDGLMFSFVQHGTVHSLEDREYVKYRHEQNLNLWNLPEDVVKTKTINIFGQYEIDVGTNYVVEIMHKNFFSQYVDKLNRSVDQLNKMPNSEFKKAISRWFDV